MKNVFKGLMMTLSITVLTAGLALSQPEPGGPGGKDLPPQLIKKLGLTEEQQEKVQSIRRNAEKEKIKAEADLRIKQIEMEEELEKKSLNEKEVFKLIDAISALQKKLLESRIKTMLALKKVLTPEQQEKMKKFMQQRKEKFGKTNGTGGPGGPDGMNKMNKKFKNKPGTENFEGGPGGPGGPGFNSPMKNKMPFNNLNPEENNGEGMVPPQGQPETSFLYDANF